MMQLGCIEVKDEKVEITNNSLYFSAYGVQAGQAIQFILDVTFFKELKADEATWKMESVGKLERYCLGIYMVQRAPLC